MYAASNGMEYSRTVLLMCVSVIKAFHIFLGHSDIVKLLIDGGADVNVANINKTTALIFASQKGMSLNWREKIDPGWTKSGQLRVCLEDVAEIISNCFFFKKFTFRNATVSI